MKKLLLVILSGLVLAGNGWCFSIDGGALDGTDVGSLDNFISSDDFLSGQSAEELWVETVLGSDVEWQIKNEDVSYYNTDGTNIFAFVFTGDSPEYYLIKNSTFVALYQNIADLGFGVFDNSDLPAGMNLPSSDFVISHVSQFNGGDTPAPVPEPATMMLFGIGLLGLAGVSRRKK
jgi:hypothetical protein